MDKWELANRNDSRGLIIPQEIPRGDVNRSHDLPVRFPEAQRMTPLINRG